MDITLTPYFSIGRILPSNTLTVDLMPIIRGMFGPHTSRSISPTFAPSLASATAIADATVDLPTPPFPLPTAIRFLTFFSNSLF